MELIVGIDIGNATTETALARIYDDNIEFLSSGIVKTTGIKGTRENINGIFASLKQAVDKANIDIKELDLIRINEAAPVIGDVAMETITETIITESTMIGHNPSTPGGIGLGVGYTIDIRKLKEYDDKKPLIVIVPKEVDFMEAVSLINESLKMKRYTRGYYAKR